MNDGVKSTGAIALVTGGIASAFALAACCAIPFFLAGFGLGSGWLVPVVSASRPHADLLTVTSCFALIGGVGLVWRAPRHCEPKSLCARPAFRWGVAAAAVIGGILLLLSKIYA